MGKPIDLTGHKFGKLAVLKKLHDTKGRVNGRLHHNWSIERALELEERK